MRNTESDDATIQILDAQHSQAIQEPAARLMLAVLEEALATFQRGLNSPVPEHRKRFYEVDTWVASDDVEWPFSFENICTTLKIDPEYIRDGLARLKRQAFTVQEHQRPRRVRRPRTGQRRIVGTMTA